MKITTFEQELLLPAGFECRSVDLSHVDSLGHLLDTSYKDTIDHQGETLPQCIQEMRDTIQGKYGPLIPEASFLVFFGQILTSAILVTEWQGRPLLADMMSDKEFQGKGLAKYLIAKSVSALNLAKRKELLLVVTQGNTPAERLYEKMGFRKAGLALPGAPPPTE